MFVSIPLLAFMIVGSLFFVLSLIWLLSCFVQSLLVKIERKEQRLLKIEEDIRYLKGIGGIENN